MLTNGAAGPGQRPVIADNNVAAGPAGSSSRSTARDELEDFQEFVDDLKTDDVANE